MASNYVQKMERFELPENLLNTLKCELCNEYLSYCPITLHADTGSVCGRCPTLEAERDITPLRECNYEKLARNLLLFPCRYRPQGCQEILAMDEVPMHEDMCSFKPFFCPILPLGNCPWLGSPEECHLHFATEHQDCLLDNNIFELNLLCTNRVNYLLSQKDSLFLLHNEFNEEEQKFYSCLYQIVSDKRIFNFSLEFKTTDAEKKFILAKKKVLFYKECIKTDGFLIDVSSVKEELNHPSMITCTVTVTEVTTGTPQDIAIILDDDEEKEEEEKSVIIKKDNKMLVDLECPVCQEYMVPPIFQCQIGHSVCGVCKPKLRDCPSCRGKIGEIRNFTLEKLTEHIMYPCRNRYEGCDYHGNTVEIKQHEQECKYAPIKCPFSDICECEWKGAYKTIVAHVKVNHNDREYIIKEPLFLSTKFSTVSGGTQCITELFNEIFRLRLVYNNEKRKVYASVQMIGPKEDAKKFMYEVIITDLNKNGLILLSKKYCGCINEKRNDISHCSIWPLEIVVPFISETNNEIHAKFRIMKV